ncbi:hypothetical protein GCM10025883_06360 [Mobilicoccus caccae]|uniref:Uncharacterized protein n=1 Tax=Mobilicoccus caccae TaxID=1859295 RepID=A0ABQ6ILI0_9MICO|nr:hypothetical protein GCM10025883_06360 [Mobilicoccus caccae]
MSRLESRAGLPGRARRALGAGKPGDALGVHNTPAKVDVPPKDIDSGRRSAPATETIVRYIAGPHLTSFEKVVPVALHLSHRFTCARINVSWPTFG